MVPLHRRAVRQLWLSLQRDACRRYPGVSFSGACLLPDHAHLIVQCDGPASYISRTVQYVASKLARGINRLMGRTGRVFRDRFFSRVLGTPSELAVALRYVGENPVRAGLARRPEDWPASSVGACLSTTRPARLWTFPGWMYAVLGFHENVPEALRRILSGQTGARRPGWRQNRLPFGRAPGRGRGARTGSQRSFSRAAM